MLVIGVVVILFGKGRISDVMGDVAKGIRSFRKGLNEDDASNGAPTAPPPRLPDPAKPLDVTPEAASDVTPRAPHAPQRRDYF